MNELDSSFKEIQDQMNDGALAIALNVGVYLGVPLILAALILRFGLKLKGTLFQLIYMIFLFGYTYFWAMNIFPKITDHL